MIGRALLVLLAMVGALYGWEWWPYDKPQAAHVLGCAFGAVTAYVARGLAAPWWPLWLVFTLALGVQVAAAACGVFYVPLASREIGACDEATGMPVGSALGVVVLFVVAEIVRYGSARRG